MSGMPNRLSGVPPFSVSHSPSIAAIFAGWCFSVLMTCWSQITDCIREITSSSNSAIENVEIIGPIATISVAPKCARGLTRFQPNSMMPRKPASRKNAVMTSYISSGPVTAPAKLEKPDQFVPNW